MPFFRSFVVATDVDSLRKYGLGAPIEGAARVYPAAA
jgi:hypothetical protein